LPERTRSSRKLLVGVLAAIAVVIAAALAAPFLVPASFISSQIAALVNQKTGRDLRIAGPISISLFPRPALVAQDVTLASPAGGFSTDFLTAKTVDVALKPLSLLHGAIDIEQLKLSQPTISLEIDKSGERNWIFRPPRPTATTAPSTSSGRAPSFGAGDVMIVDGTVSYLDQRGGTKRTVGGLNMTVSLPSLDAPLKAAGAGTYNNEPVTLTLGVASPAELRAGRASAATIDITSARGTFAFQGTIETSDPPKAIGTTDFRTPSLRDLLAWARIAVAPQDSELGALSIAGKVDLSGPKLTLADAAITLDDVAAKGTLVLTRSDRQLELDLNDTALSGGKAAGKIVVDDSGPLPAIAASGHLTGITVNRLSLNIAGFETLSGTGDLAFDLTGSGKTMRELVASLNGSGSINFTNGTVGAAGLGPLMRNTIGPVVNDKTIPREIAYRSLSATATIRQGILRNDDLKLSGPQVSATGAGTLNLAPRQINYQWNPDIVGLGTAQVAITGAWENPEYKVESVSITKGLSIPGLKLR
jgi:AsmA protein